MGGGDDVARRERRRRMSWVAGNYIARDVWKLTLR